MRKMSKLMALLLVAVLLLMLMPAAALASEEEITVDETVIVEQTVEEKPVIEEEPVVEEPIVEEAVVEEAVEEPIVEQGVFIQPTLLLIKDAITTIDVLLDNEGDGYAYNPVDNALTLDNFTGEALLAGLLDDNFAIVLHGTNTLVNNMGGFAVYVEGDLNLSGCGTLVASGVSNDAQIGGGIQVTEGDLVIDGGKYDIDAINNSTAGSINPAFGILVGNRGPDIPGDLTINGGKFDIAVFDPETAGTYGIAVVGDITVNGGRFNVLTSSRAGYSTGFYAANDLVFNGGKVKAGAFTDTGVATALWADEWLVINDGCFKLKAEGGDAPLALWGGEGISINSRYGEVDTSASSLELCCKDKCDHKVKCAKAACDNPKTGVPEDTIMTTLIILSLTGLAIAAIKRRFQS